MKKKYLMAGIICFVIIALILMGIVISNADTEENEIITNDTSENATNVSTISLSTETDENKNDKVSEDILENSTEESTSDDATISVSDDILSDSADESSTATESLTIEEIQEDNKEKDDVKEIEEKYMSFTVFQTEQTQDEAVYEVEFYQGNSDFDECAILFSVTFDGDEHDITITSPSGKTYTKSNISAYNKEEIVGIGIISYYRIENVETGVYKLTSSDGGIFNVSATANISNSETFTIDKNGDIKNSMVVNAISEEEYEEIVDEAIEDSKEEIEEKEDNDTIIESGINIEGITDDIDASDGELTEIEKIEEEIKQQSKEILNK